MSTQDTTELEKVVRESLLYLGQGFVYVGGSGKHEIDKESAVRKIASHINRHYISKAKVLEALSVVKEEPDISLGGNSYIYSGEAEARIELKAELKASLGLDNE